MSTSTYYPPPILPRRHYSRTAERFLGIEVLVGAKFDANKTRQYNSRTQPTPNTRVRQSASISQLTIPAAAVVLTFA
jgi:hypothetical protein